MTRAALVQGWNFVKSKSGKAALATLQPSGSIPVQGPNDPTGLKIEIFVNNGWEDITPFMLYRNQTGRASISRGRPDETSQAQPQTCSLEIQNRDFRFSPRNPSGPYYGSIGRNTQIRVSRTWNGITWYRYYGEVPSWPVNAEVTGSDISVQVSAFGVLRRLNQGTPPMQSAMRRSIVSPLRIGEPDIVAYWPLEDGSNATQFASGISGQSSMQVVNSGISPASSSTWLGSSPIPVMNSGVISGAIPSYPSTGNANIGFESIFPSGGVAGNRTLITANSNGTAAQWTVQVDSSGDLAVNAFDVSGASILSTGFVAFNVNGKNVQINLLLSQSGSDINWNLFVAHPDFTASAFSAIPRVTIGGTVTSHTVGVFSSVVLGDSSGLGSTAFGHLAVGSQTGAFSSTGQAVLANQGEDPVHRFLRLSNEQSINGSVVDSAVYSGNDVSMGAQLPSSYTNLVQQVSDTDLSLLYESREQLGPVQRTRLSLYNQSPKLTLDYAQNQLSQNAVPLDDDTYTRNDITVQNVGKSSSVAQQNSGTLNLNNPPAGVGDYGTSPSISVFSDTQLPDQAGWRLHMGTVDEPRYPSVSINLRHPQFTNNPVLLSQVLSVDIGDRIAINNPPPWLPPDNISLIVQGYKESIGTWEHDITFNCSPESPYRIAVLDDPVLSRADTDGSTLVNPLSTVLNGNPAFNDGNGNPTSVGWSSFGATFTIVGTSGAARPLPAGGPTGYGAKVTVDGTSGPGIFGNAAGNIFPVAQGTTYRTSALVYYPTALNTMFVGINWYDVNLGFISTSFTNTVVSAATWTALTSGGFTAPSNAVWGGPVVGLSGTSTNGDTYYTTNSVVWSGDVSVSTTSSSYPLWTTASADFPFDINVGGERMTVTGITGSSSPQSFTVARSINGVIKPQTSGTDIRLWQPMILSL